jgi:predicted nuclease with TOPRIM domain
MKDFNKKYNITRHINNYCSTIKKLNENKSKLNEQKNKLNEEMINLRTQIELQELRKAVTKILKRKPQNINITNNNKITNNKITNNNLMVNINSFGSKIKNNIFFIFKA